MPFETRVFAQGRVRVTVHNSLVEADRATRGVASKVVHVGEKAGPAAVDNVMCQRCNSTARWGVEAFVCPRCGPLRHSFGVRDDVADDLGYHPVVPEDLTGHYVVNPRASLREPGRIWVEGKSIT